MTEERPEVPDTEGSEVVPGDDDNAAGADCDKKRGKEIGGRDGPDPSRYGDWEKDGRCIDF